MSSPNLESFINEMNISDMEKSSLSNFGKVVQFILNEQLKCFKSINERIELVEKAVAKVEENHIKLIEDNLRMTQTNELFKSIDTTKIQEFNAEATQILKDVASPELKLSQMTYEEYFIERGIDKGYVMKSRGVERDIIELIKVMYKQAVTSGMFNEAPTLEPTANDIQKREFLAAGFKFMCDNVDNSLIKNACVINKNIKSAYNKYTNPNM